MKKAGFIGTGNMGGALARAAVNSIGAQDVILYDRDTNKAQALADELGCEAGEMATLLTDCRYLFLGVKPNIMPVLMQEISPALERRNDRYVLVSMAAGTSMEQIESCAGISCPIIRIMPNTPAAIGEGMILYDYNQNVSDDEVDGFLEILRKAGRLTHLKETLIDAGSAVSGCGPAFVDLFIEALADGGVACGLSRKDAMEFAAAMVAGSARMVLESGKHPGELKDAVCSPGGTTIQGVRVLEETGFRGAVMDAVIAAYEKTIS